MNPQDVMQPSDVRPTAAARKGWPVTTGVLDYFPMAILEVAELSKAGNDQHNPGEPLHWARGKSADHADCIVRHLMERGTRDNDGIRHSAKVAWRALAMLQEEIEAEAGFVPGGEEEGEGTLWCVRDRNWGDQWYVRPKEEWTESAILTDMRSPGQAAVFGSREAARGHMRRAVTYVGRGGNNLHRGAYDLYVAPYEGV